MAANKKGEIPGFIFGLPDEFDELLGIHGATRRIEKDLARAGMPGEEIKTGWSDLVHIAACITAASLEEFRGNSVGMCVARFADVIEKKLQSRAVEDRSANLLWTINDNKRLLGITRCRVEIRRCRGTNPRVSRQP